MSIARNFIQALIDKIVNWRLHNYIPDDVHKTPDSCSQFYPGAKPFSSPEAQALRRYLNGLSDSTISLAIHLHSSFVPKKVKIKILDISQYICQIHILYRGQYAYALNLCTYMSI